MKIKNKGKVYPSPPPPQLSSSVNGEDGFLSVLKLLPAAILVLASALSAEDREVLAYLITRSLKTTTTAAAAAASGKSRSPCSAAASSPSSSSSSSMTHDSKKKNKKKSGKKGEAHKPPEFDCECFDCYTSYWFRWDSSSNRELIHHVIEAFEDHLISGEASSSQKPKRNNGRGKKKEKSGRRGGDKPKPAEPSIGPDESTAVSPEISAVPDEIAAVSPASSPGRFAGKRDDEVAEEVLAGETPESSPVVAVRTPAQAERKGLARKVLPDVLGLFNSRIWSLWNPNA
ncbi:PREDICTED: uncharacterized protein LOC104825487 [Tarenaya hassleriana]|uniref:uncharacterized protein LOC104825487 n=1 Tax=Tarenaya hassleriana TaxID=28532 RepID=UPI00053C0A20|nr:PREDICTED: uncharacterized protein LOC104825487 [Tarenaya hassleriana]